MANPTTTLNITLPEPGSESSRGTWGTTINNAISDIDVAIGERGVPAGGTDDQILTKSGTTDYATEWSNRLSSVGIVGTDGIEVDSGSPVTTSGNIILGIASSGVSAGSYGSASAIPVITFDAKGRATSASTAAFTGVTEADVVALSIALG
tara:strand:+ start:85 stop:537 length:453 start_codon:yes stop_codon:yes gene_type:complete